MFIKSAKIAIEYTQGQTQANASLKDFERNLNDMGIFNRKIKEIKNTDDVLLEFNTPESSPFIKMLTILTSKIFQGYTLDELNDFVTYISSAALKYERK